MRWDIDKDVIRGCQFDFGRKFLPDRPTRMERFGIATAEEKRLIGQVA